MGCANTWENVHKETQTRGRMRMALEWPVTCLWVNGYVSRSHAIPGGQQSTEWANAYQQAAHVKIPARAIIQEKIVFVGARYKHVTIQTIGSRPYVPKTSHVIIDRQRTDRTVDNSTNMQSSLVTLLPFRRHAKSHLIQQMHANLSDKFLPLSRRDLSSTIPF